MTEETTIHQDQAITITTTRIVVQNKTYPINNITSVGINKTEASNLAPLLFIIIGGFTILYSFTNITENFGKLFIGILMVAAGIGITRTLKPTYNLTLSTAAGEVRAFESQDQAYIQKLNEAINQAIIQRG